MPPSPDAKPMPLVPASDPERPWVLYWLNCRHGKTYVGITNNLEKRFRAHQSGKGGRFTRAFPPCGILGVQPFPDRGSASRAEHELKSRSVAGKWAWAATWGYPPQPRLASPATAIQS